jgi:hypothetical protein
MPYNFYPRRSRQLWWVMFVVCAGVAVVMLGIGLDGLYENYRFATGSVHTEGRVDSEYVQGVTGRYNTSYRRTLAYSYTVDGISYSSGVKMVARSTWAQYRDGDAIPIVYLRDAPADSRPDLPAEDAIYRWVPLAVTGIGAGFVFGLFSMWRSEAKLRRRRRGATQIRARKQKMMQTG